MKHLIFILCIMALASTSIAGAGKDNTHHAKPKVKKDAVLPCTQTVTEEADGSFTCPETGVTTNISAFYTASATSSSCPFSHAEAASIASYGAQSALNTAIGNLAMNCTGNV
jgi:hypothetical protein